MPACGPGGYDTRGLGRAEAWVLDRSEAAAAAPAVVQLDRLRGQVRFLIGARHVLSPRRAGVLHVFPNDVPGMYWNNTGAVSLRITRVT